MLFYGIFLVLQLPENIVFYGVFLHNGTMLEIVRKNVAFKSLGLFNFRGLSFI